MRHALKMHPESLCTAVVGIEVSAVRQTPGRLRLHYDVSGVITKVRFPPSAKPARADELWRHTCFEMLLQAPGGAGYWEFNFSPSSEWGAYRFTDYRAGMRPCDLVAAPAIEIQTGQERFEMVVALDLAGLGLPPNAVWRAGLSVIIEGRDPHKSWWALAHPPGKPDFHQPCNFALDLPAAG